VGIAFDQFTFLPAKNAMKILALESEAKSIETICRMALKIQQKPPPFGLFDKVRVVMARISCN
jgi:hypothetical protein